MRSAFSSLSLVSITSQWIRHLAKQKMVMTVWVIMTMVWWMFGANE
jgi:hypothetical protein